ncbi:LPXTG cell wall anchor domain-containing protein, partial [Staphylococcus aureus]|uniref:LPXTG cell wall anchor domain-containing protein n=1 Tax=Staphylococcus aureus TaxID=1280 RepID=UPI00065BFCDA
SDSDSDSKVTSQYNEQKASSNHSGEDNHSNKETKQHKADDSQETGDKRENTNASLFGAMIALLGSLLVFRKRKHVHKEYAYILF